MRRLDRTGQWVVLLAGLAMLSLVAGPALAQHNIYFEEDWEAGAGLWSASNGSWQVGAPSYGTSECRGNQCAATNLTGPYAYNTNSRLESVTIDLPAAGTLADGVLWLGFWHWFSYSASNGVDYGSPQIWTAADGWQDVSIHFDRGSSVWTPYYADITSYAGETIKLGFLMDDEHTTSFNYEGPGWYVDDIAIFDGAFPELGQITSFENEDDRDWNGWYPDAGIWERGTPTAGITEAFSGQNCFGTVLSGNYPYLASSRLLSPFFTLPASPQDGLLYLSFKQYCGFHNNNGIDQGHVQIHDGVDWVTLQTQDWQNNLGGQWTERVADLSAYAGQRVRLGFFIEDAHTTSFNYESRGWYIDDVRFSEGDRHVGNPERFENNATCWETTYGQWEVGEPTSGPGSAYSGNQCWATNLDGNYRYGVDDLLSTPPITLNSDPGLTLVFQHWYSFSSSNGIDSGIVKILPEGGSWTDLATFTGVSGGWTSYSQNLAAYAGQTVQFGFLMDEAHTTSFNYESSGWYIDDFEIVGLPSQEVTPPLYLEVTISAGPAQLVFPHVPQDKVIIYASPVPDFQPSLGTRLAILPGDTNLWSDTARPGWSDILYYKVSVVDAAGNESVQVEDPLPTAAPEHDGIPAAGPLVFGSVTPNPFNPSTTIEFTLAAESEVDVAVYNLAGRKVADVLHERLAAGSHLIPFRPRNLASGTYFARIQAGPQVHTAKMMLLK